MTNPSRLINQKMREVASAQVSTQIGHQQRLMADMQYFPMEVVKNRTIPAGKQLVLDTLTVSSGVTLTVDGHLRVLSDLTNHGTIIVNGSIRNG